MMFYKSFFILLPFITHYFEGLYDPKKSSVALDTLYPILECNSTENLENLGYRYDPNDFRFQRIIIYGDVSYPQSEMITTQISCFLFTFQEKYGEKFAVNFTLQELNLRIFSKHHCDILYKEIGKLYKNSTIIVISGGPFICKKEFVVGNFIFISPIETPMVISKMVDGKKYQDWYVNESLEEKGVEVPKFITKNFMTTKSIKEQNEDSRNQFQETLEGTSQNYSTKGNIKNCDVYEGDRTHPEYKNLESIIQMQSLKISAPRYDPERPRYKLHYKIYNQDNSTDDTNGECWCSYFQNKFLLCLMTNRQNPIAYINLDNFHIKNRTGNINYKSFEDLVKDKGHLLEDTLFEEVKIYPNVNSFSEYEYNRFINVYYSSKRTKLNFYVEIESITKPMLKKKSFIILMKTISMYSSIPKKTFMGIKKIKKNPKVDVKITEASSLIDKSLFITLCCFIFVALVPSVTFFRQQRVIALRKIVEIDDTDYECIELQCSIAMVCTDKELESIKRVIKGENISKRRPLINYGALEEDSLSTSKTKKLRKKKRSKTNE